MSLYPSILILLIFNCCLYSIESSPSSSFSQTLIRHRLRGELPRLKPFAHAAYESLPRVATLTKWLPSTWESLGRTTRAQRSMQEKTFPEDYQEYSEEGFEEDVEEDVEEASGEMSDGSCTEDIPASLRNAQNLTQKSIAASICKGNMKKTYGALDQAIAHLAILDYRGTHKRLSRAMILVNECITWGNSVEGGDLQVAGTIITTAISCLDTKLNETGGAFRKRTPLQSVIIDQGFEPMGEAALGNYDLTYSKNGTGTRVYSEPSFLTGVFSAYIRCPAGNTSGVLTSFFLATNFTDSNRSSIVFEMRGKHRNLGMIQTIDNGVTSDRTAVDLGYDCAEDYHLYSIYWTPKMIIWMSDNNVLHMYDKPTWYARVPSGNKMHLYFGIEALETYTTPTWQTAVDLGTETDSVTASFKNVTIRSPILKMPKLNRKAVNAPMLTMATDYCGDHMSFERSSSSANITFDNTNCGGRFHSGLSYFSGEFTTKFKCADGNTSGLLPSFYLSSREGTIDQDEIDFEWLGYNKSVVQSNYFVNGTGGHEVWFELGFDCSEDFHTYTIRWSPVSIRWLVDGVLHREVFKSMVTEYPVKPQYLYGSVWNASSVNFGGWSGVWDGKDAPFLYQYRNIQITSPVKK